MKKLIMLAVALLSIAATPSSDVDLFITKLKVQNTIFFTLHHSGITTLDMDIYRNGVFYKTVGAGAPYGDITVMGHHKLTFVVCEAGTNICSPEVAL